MPNSLTPLHGHRLRTCCTTSTTCCELVRSRCPCNGVWHLWFWGLLMIVTQGTHDVAEPFCQRTISVCFPVIDAVCVDGEFELNESCAMRRLHVERDFLCCSEHVHVLCCVRRRLSYLHGDVMWFDCCRRPKNKPGTTRTDLILIARSVCAGPN